MKGLINAIKDSKLGKRAFNDPLFRVLMISGGSMGWNLIYAVFNGIQALVYRSFWFLTLCVYYAILGIMRLVVVAPLKRKKGNKWYDSSVMRGLGFGMIVLSIAVSGMVCLVIAQKQNPKYNIIVMITIAAYTFYLITMSVINTVRAQKKRNATLIMLRNITLAGTIVAVLSLERAMLGTFGNAEDSFTMITESVTGGVSFVLINAIGVGMLIQAGRLTDERAD
ncbi:MAG: hypothetical protein IKW95_02185 [Lachnospiraceae bacterium]|nr:hypothetical protein [Lachnospiraceae bacterium]